MTTGPIEAIVMAGGKGKRLMPYTTVLPKPLMPLGDAPVLEHLLRKLHAHGIRRVCLAVNHLHHLIHAFFGDGSALGLSIEYAIEDFPQVMTDHKRRESAATVAVLKRRTQLEYGVLDTDARGRVTGIREKPTMDYLVSMGVYALRRDSLRLFLTPGQALDMPDVLNAMVSADHAVHAYIAECEWLDIGRPEDYAQALSMVAQESTAEASS
jgi:NDP-sugar pyrophosphorylase family protein